MDIGHQLRLQALLHALCRVQSMEFTVRKCQSTYSRLVLAVSTAQSAQAQHQAKEQPTDPATPAQTPPSPRKNSSCAVLPPAPPVPPHKHNKSPVFGTVRTFAGPPSIVVRHIRHQSHEECVESPGSRPTVVQRFFQRSSLLRRSTPTQQRRAPAIGQCCERKNPCHSSNTVEWSSSSSFRFPPFATATVRNGAEPRLPPAMSLHCRERTKSTYENA